MGGVRLTGAVLSFLGSCFSTVSNILLLFDVCLSLIWLPATVSVYFPDAKNECGYPDIKMSVGRQTRYLQDLDTIKFTVIWGSVYDKTLSFYE